MTEVFDRHVTTLLREVVDAIAAELMRQLAEGVHLPLTPGEVMAMITTRPLPESFALEQCPSDYCSTRVRFLLSASWNVQADSAQEVLL